MDLARIAALHPHHDAQLGLLVLDLDHGKANEVGTEELTAFEALCELIESDTSLTCVCTTSRRTSSKGRPIFISGANVTERAGWTDDRVKAHVTRQRGVMQRIRKLPVFTVVASHGVTLGWGVEFLLTADYVLSTPAATFGLPETGLGIVPGARGTAELASVVGPGHALRLGCVGETIGTDEAVRIGLVHETASTIDAALERVRILASQLRRRSPTAVAAFKRSLLESMGQPEATRIRLEQAAYEHCIDSGEATIGRRSFSLIVGGQVPTWGPRRDR